MAEAFVFMLNWLRLSGSLAADEACDVSLRILCRCLAPLASANRYVGRSNTELCLSPVLHWHLA